MGNDKTQKRKVQIISALTLFVFLVDIYLIIYVPTDYILATAAFVTFMFTIFTFNSWFKLKEIEEHRREEQYTDIMKAEKGTYVVTLEMMKEMNEKINFIGQKIMPLGKAGDENQRKIASMLDSIVQDQKKIAKITISRSKENADALMNSNDQLLAQMTAFRDSIDVIRDQISKQLEMNDQGNGDIGAIKNELFEKIQELTESIKNEVDEISENIEISNQSMENIVSADEAEMQKETAAQSTYQEAAMSAKEPAVSEAAMSAEELMAPEEPVMSIEEPAVPEEAVMSADELAVPEAVMSAEEPVIPQDSVQTEVIKEEPAMADMTAEEPAVSGAAVSAEEPMLPEEPVIPEAIEIDNDAISELIMEKKPLDEAIVMEESPVEQPASEPVISDPNKPMSPDDIAALLASTAEQSSSESKPEPVISDPNKPMSPEDIAALIANTETEDLPEETKKFEEEEKPSMPDMSDPNKPMSPDDIAALIANM